MSRAHRTAKAAALPPVTIRDLWMDPTLETRRMSKDELARERELIGTIAGRPIEAASVGYHGGSITFRYQLGSRS